MTSMRAFGRMLAAFAISAAVVAGPTPARAANTVFTAPYSGDTSAWGCPDCTGLSWEVEHAASKSDGSMRAAATLSAKSFSTAGGSAIAFGMVQQYMFQGKPVHGLSVTIEYEVGSASTSTTGSGGETGLVRLVVSAWNANCACETSASSIVAETQAGVPDSFAGPRPVTLFLAAPSNGRLIKGTTLIRASLEAEAVLPEVALIEATAARQASASASAVVARMIVNPSAP